MYRMDNKTKVLLFFPVIFTVVLIIVGNCIDFKGGHTEGEKLMLNFSPSDLSIKEKHRNHITRTLNGFFDFHNSALPPGLAHSEVPRETGHNNGRLSLTVISDNRKMAIIDGMLIKEGDKIDDKIIVKIETDRVLLKDRSSKWVYLEREQ